VILRDPFFLVAFVVSPHQPQGSVLHRPTGAAMRPETWKEINKEEVHGSRLNG
jgi:hypothetical protein